MARVYVGTWKKYNEGSIAGGWIDLADCQTYADFLRKCKALHRNESDPEYMIQDCEGFPDGLGVTDWLSEQDFNDVKTAMKEEEQAETPAPQFTIVDYSDKAIAVTGDTKPIACQLRDLGGRFNFRLTCGAGWIFPKSKESEVRALLNGGAVMQTKGAPKGADIASQLKAEYLKYVEQMNDTAYWKDYYRKRKSLAVRLQDGWCVIDKPSIDNRFCFHDDGPQYDLYLSLMSDKKKLERYFLSENLSEIDREIENLKRTDEPLYTRPLSNNAVEVLTHHAIYSWCEYRNGSKQPRQITAEERASLLTAYGIVRAEFEKRLQTYLRRYGTSKLHTWTYWADA